MKILLVRPENSKETIGLQHVMIVEPLELEILGTLIRSTDQAVIVDMILEKKPFEYFLKLHKPDILCVTGYITAVNIMINYCRQAKTLNPGITTIVGGVHCEVCPEDFESEFIDYRVVRNASTIFTNLLDCIERKKNPPSGVLSRGQSSGSETLPVFDFSVPMPDRRLTARYRKSYFYIFHNKVALIKTSFGCPYVCSFCFCRIITNDTYKQRPMDEVLKELAGIRETEIYIVDDDFLVDEKRLHQFIEGVKRLNLQKHYLVYGRADFIANHPDIIAELKSIGLRTVIVGFESFSETELQQYNKRTDIETNKRAMAVLNRLKIDCFATIILSPAWDKSDFKQMQKTLKELGIHFVNLQPLTPLPKTGIEFPEKDILIKKVEFEKWDLAHVSIRPEKLTVPEYYDQILKSYNAVVFQPKAILKYLTSYSLPMLWKMITGSRRVSRQYKQKMTEAHA